MRRAPATLTTLGLLLAFTGSLAAQPDTQLPAQPAAPIVSVPPGTKLPLELQDPLHSRDSRKGDKVEFQVLRDIELGGNIVIPQGSTVRATVTKVKKPGMGGAPARIHLEFNQVELPDGTVLPLQAELVSAGGLPIQQAKKSDKKKDKSSGVAGQDGGSRTRDAVMVAVGAGQGALIGAAIGGKKGAAYGGAIGAGIGLLELMMQRGPHLDLPAGMLFEIALAQPVAVPENLVAQFNRPAQPSVLSASAPADQPFDFPDSSSDSSSVSSAGSTSAASEPPVPDFPEDDSEVMASNRLPPAVPGLPPPPPYDPSLPDSDYRMRVNVRLVMVEAFVRDDRGRLLNDLTAEDFRVFEDGVEQQVRHFSRDELPLAVALVVDRSGSVIPYMNELRRAAYDTLSLLKPGDRVALFTFAEDIERLTDLTTDRRRVAERISRIRAGGDTNILDALHTATQYLALAAPQDRRAIILISDNEATMRGFASQDRVIRQAWQSEVVVYSIKTPGQSVPLIQRLGQRLSGVGSVGKITRETGGEIIDVQSTGSVEAALHAVINRLKTRYTLGYQSTNHASDGAFRAIEVRLADRYGQPERDYTVHAKKGYYAPTEQVAAQPTPAPAR